MTDHYDYYHQTPLSRRGRWVLDRHAGMLAELVGRYGKQPGCSVLEIGPGRGRVGLAFERKGYYYIAVECSEKGAENIRRLGLECLCAKWPTKNVVLKYDVIIAISVFEHCNSFDEADRFMKACYDRLRPGGLIILQTPEMKYWGAKFYDGYTHNFPTTIIRNRKMLRDFGFKILFARYIVFWLTGLRAWLIYKLLHWWRNKGDCLINSIIVAKKQF